MMLNCTGGNVYSVESCQRGYRSVSSVSESPIIIICCCHLEMYRFLTRMVSFLFLLSIFSSFVVNITTFDVNDFCIYASHYITFHHIPSHLCLPPLFYCLCVIGCW
jgi:hypothetical protein